MNEGVKIVKFVDQEAKKAAKLEKVLRFMARMILRKYHPRIISVTGSLGKNSAKEAIYSTISDNFFVRKSQRNHNNITGVPLTIIGAQRGEKSLLKWAGVFFRWLAFLVFPLKYPEILILEMSADRPGDLEYLTDFVKPDISIITEIASSHLGQYKNIEGIFREKITLAKVLPEKGLLIINGDNPYLSRLKDNPRQFGIAARIFSFGFSESADARAMDVFVNNCSDENTDAPSGRGVCTSGLSFKLNYKGTTMPLRLNKILAQHDIYAALAGVSVGIELGINLVEVAENLENFSLE